MKSNFEIGLARRLSQLPRTLSPRSVEDVLREASLTLQDLENFTEQDTPEKGTNLGSPTQSPQNLMVATKLAAIGTSVAEQATAIRLIKSAQMWLLVLVCLLVLFVGVPFMLTLIWLL